MKKCIITFRSVTPAQRAEEVLRRAGVECSIQRTPKWMEEKGCGYYDIGGIFAAGGNTLSQGLYLAG